MHTKKIKFTAVLAAAAVTLGAAGSFPLPAEAKNPIIQTSFTPDPAPVVFGDTLYVYTGCDKDARNDNYYMTGYQCFSTTDMQNWTDHGRIMEDSDFSWGKKDSAWASQCIERNGKYYFYVTMNTSSGDGYAIGVAVADKPEGPFKDALGKPLAGPNWSYIDPTVMIDDDGQAWLFFGNSKCFYAKLNEDMISLNGPVQQCNMTAESFGSGKNGTAYGEGPWIYKHGNLYYLVFASFYGSDGNESMAYSTSSSITGPWTFRGQIMKQHNCFTTHGGIIDYKDKSYFFYHKIGLDGGGTFNRSACVEEFSYASDGSIPLLSPSDDGPKQIESLNPYQRVEAETMSWSSGIKTEKIDAGTLAIGFVENNDYVKVSGVDFGDNGATDFFASVASAGSGGKIELHLDSLTGSSIGSVDCPVTDGWQNWETVSCKVSGATGKHDLFLRFTGGDSYLFNVDWWQFKQEGDNTNPGEVINEDGGVVRKHKDAGILGDVDGDGKINASDLSLAKKLFIAKTTNKNAIKEADVNCNGKLEADDIEWYVEYLTGKTTAYPEKVSGGSGSLTGELGTDGYQYPQNLQWHEFDGKYLENMNNGGRVIEEKYNGINGNKTMYVYLPPGYDENKKYNVFYLMHGGNENERTLFFQSDTMMQNILDHMILNGELEPLICVTPTFNNCPNGSYDVYDEIRKTIIPYVESKYSTYAEDTTIEGLKASRYHRAYGGFSMGGGSTWINLLHNLDIIAYYMPLSGHNWGGVGEIQKAIDDSGFSPREYFIFAATGTSDIAYNNMVPQINEMKADTKRFVYTSDFSKGNFYFLTAPGKDHWWGNVRHYVYDGLPLFFHENQG